MFASDLVSPDNRKEKTNNQLFTVIIKVDSALILHTVYMVTTFPSPPHLPPPRPVKLPERVFQSTREVKFLFIPFFRW